MFQRAQAEAFDPMGRDPGIGAGGKPQLLSHGQMREQAVVLRDVGDAARHGIQMRQLAAVHGHAAAVARVKAGDQPQGQ